MDKKKNRFVKIKEHTTAEYKDQTESALLHFLHQLEYSKDDTLERKIMMSSKATDMLLLGLKKSVALNSRFLAKKIDGYKKNPITSHISEDAETIMAQLSDKSIEQIA